MSVVSNNILAGASGQGGGGYEIERSLRFNSGDSAYLNRTPSSAGNRKTWTISVWCKKTANGSYMPLINANNSANPYLNLVFTNADQIRWLDGGNQGQVLTDAVFRDNSAWYHIVCATDTTLSTATDRVKIYVNGVRQDVTFPVTVTQNHQTQVNNTTEHRIGRWLGTSNNYLDGYLAEYILIDGQALAPSDFGEYDDNNVWQPKEYAGTYGTNGFHLDFSDNSSDAALGTDTSGAGNDWTINNISVTQASYSSDMSGLYGLTSPKNAFDGSTSTVCKDQDGTFNTTRNPPYTLEFIPSTPIPFSSQVRVFTGLNPGSPYNGKIYVDTGSGYGSAITPVQSTWQTIVSGSGSLYKIKCTGDQNEANLNAVEVDGTVLVDSETDSFRDSPSQIADQTDTGVGGEVVGNYCTWNPLNKASAITTSDGNLKAQLSSAGHVMVTGTMGMPKGSGKYYWEIVTAGWNTSNQGPMIGVVGDTHNIADQDNGSPTILYRAEGVVRVNGSSVASGQTTWTAGDVIGVALDLDNNNITWYKNGSQLFQYTSVSSSVNAWIPAWKDSDSGGNAVGNWGQRAFTHAGPSGYKALCTANLSDPTIADGSTYFDTKLWSGDNASSRSITGYNFSPDWVWIKDRSQAFFHELQDTVRGAGKRLSSDSTAAEDTSNQTMTAFNSDGFTVNYISGSGRNTNESGDAYVGWAWDAGEATTTIAAGGLNSSVYYQSYTWSNSITSSGGFNAGCGPVTNAFNNNLANGVCASAGDNIIFTNPESTSTLTGALEFYCRGDTTSYGRTVIVAHSAGTTAAIPLTTNSVWQDLGTYTGITSITCTGTGGGGGVIDGIRIGGRLLVDSGVSVANVPSIASTYRANPSAGFSIVSYTSASGTGDLTASIGHGLNASPGLIIIKSRDFQPSSQGWAAWHSSVPTETGYLDTTGTFSNSEYTAFWNAAPTNYVFSVRSKSSVSSPNRYRTYGNSHDYIAYCFAPVEGYSAMGSYTGNGSTDGPFVYTGFRPRWIMIKNSSASGTEWVLHDTERDPDNIVNHTLLANSSAAEGTPDRLDILSNGFKVRLTAGSYNGSGNTLIYAAFAEHPFKTSRAR